MQDLILIGMQGSGKGTQGKLLKQEFGYKIFDTGESLRNIAKEDSSLGRKVKSIIESGNLVETKIVMEVVEDFINKLNKSDKILFDGIPRSKDQREGLEKILSKFNKKAVAIYINISKDIAEKRLLSRKICKSCKQIFTANYKDKVCNKCGTKISTREDDNPEAIKKRINIFFEETMPIIKYYESEDRYILIDGEKSIEEVFNEIKNKIM